MKLSHMAFLVHGRLVGEDREISTFSTDTRTLKGGELFIALSGAHFNGNRFAADAAARGAVAVVVSEEQPGLAVPQVLVDDTHEALGRIAHAWRQQFDIVSVAMTGSAGKTTTKEFVASIFSEMGPTLATLGNKNNDIGVPLTLFRLNASHRYGVFELGANHVGEIAYTSALVEPQAVVITNVGTAHLEGFGSREGIARAKGEIYGGLVKGGIACINVDDEFAPYWIGLNEDRQQLHFSMARQADLWVDNVRQATSGCYAFDLHVGSRRVAVELQMLGRHNISNALAAAALAHACQVPLDKIAQGLARTRPAPGRLNVHVPAPTCRVIDDTYNANPSSMKAAIDVLTEMPGRKVLVLGDMGELGSATESGHREVGEYARMKKIDALYTVGQYSQFTAAGFGSEAHVYSDQQALIGELEKELETVVTLLVKGSRSAQMEKVVTALLDKATTDKKES
ncbi:MAG TPA: UDP-N-acetylmuramoyl-tripeptide--D-alanyl-D-alanine ligase [Moraxellaceae bacterium]|nr:UDP-N-acetylmuramoyl-tripeptide--D-alanyl-D-alanine ligase [Moraxellaceae bacterium]